MTHALLLNSLHAKLFALIVLPFKESVRGQEYQVAAMKLETRPGDRIGSRGRIPKGSACAFIVVNRSSGRE